jgi:hypothetical protein
MQYVVIERDDTLRGFATNVRTDQSGTKIVWDASSGQDVLIVQTPYAYDALDIIDSICDAMTGMTLPSDVYVEISAMPGVWVRYVPSASFARNAGCPIRAKACTYTVFCCKRDGDTCNVYRQFMKAGNVPYRRIKLEINACVSKITRLVGPPWKRREEDTGYYQITLPKERAGDVDDGDVLYTVAGAGNIEIPLTKKMFERGYVYVQTHDKPALASRNDGLLVKQ